MNNTTKNITTGTMIALMAVTLAACQKQDGAGPAESAGKSIDNAVDSAGKKVDNAMDTAGKKMESAADTAGQKVDSAVDATGKKVEETGQKMQDATK